MTAAAGLAEASTSTCPVARAHLFTRSSIGAALRLLSETADPWGEGECQRLAAFALLNASSLHSGARSLLRCGALSPLTVTFDATPRARLDAAAQLYTAGTLANLITAGGARAAAAFRSAGGPPTLLFLLRRATGRDGFLVNALRRFPAALAAAYVEFDDAAAGDLVAGGAVEALVDALHTASAGGDSATLIEAIGAIAAIAGAAGEAGAGESHGDDDSPRPDAPPGSSDRALVQRALVTYGAIGACVVAAATPVLNAAPRAALALAHMSAQADAEQRTEISQSALETLAVLGASDDVVVRGHALRALVYLAVDEEVALALDTAEVGCAIAAALAIKVAADGTISDSSSRADEETDAVLVDISTCAALDLAAVISSHARVRARGGALETVSADRLASILSWGLRAQVESPLPPAAFAAAALTLSNWVADAAGRRALSLPHGGRPLEVLAAVARAPAAPVLARRHALTALANFAGAGCASVHAAAAAGALNSALAGATIDDGRCRAAAARILRGLALGSPELCAGVISAGAMATVIMLLDNDDTLTRTHAIAALQALCSTALGAAAAAAEGVPRLLARVAEAALRAGASQSAFEGVAIALAIANLTAEPLALEACAATPRLIECLLAFVHGSLGPRAARAAATALAGLSALPAARAKILLGVIDSVTDGGGFEGGGESSLMTKEECSAVASSITECASHFDGSATSSSTTLRPTINLDVIDAGESGGGGDRQHQFEAIAARVKGFATSLISRTWVVGGADGRSRQLQGHRAILYSDAISPAPAPAPVPPTTGAAILVAAATALDSPSALASEALRCLANCASVDCAGGASALWAASAPHAATMILTGQTASRDMKRLASALLSNAALSSFACPVSSRSFRKGAAHALHAHALTPSHPPPVRPASHYRPRAADGQCADDDRLPDAYILSARHLRPLRMGAAHVARRECCCSARAPPGTGYIRIVGCERARSRGSLPHAPRRSPRRGRALRRAHSRSPGRRAVFAAPRACAARRSGCNPPREFARTLRSECDWGSVRCACEHAGRVVAGNVPRVDFPLRFDTLACRQHGSSGYRCARDGCARDCRASSPRGVRGGGS